MAQEETLSLAEQIAAAAAGQDTTENSRVIVESGASLKTKSGSGSQR